MAEPAIPTKIEQKTPAKASFFNKDALLGFLPGIGLAVCVSVGSGLFGLGLGLAAAGGLIGGLVGKSNEEKKMQQGEDAPPPKPNRNAWNKDALLGGLLGLVSARLLTMGAMSFFTAATAPAALAVGTAITTGMLIGVYLGGRYGQSCQETEYEQYMRRKMSTMLSAAIAPEMIPLVVGMAQAQGNNYTDRIIREQIQREHATPGISPQ